jgi:transposase InsO family protein
MVEWNHHKTKHHFEGELLMARLTQAEKKRKQAAKNRQKAVEYAIKHGNKSAAARLYLVSLSSIKRWCKRYDGTWQSLAERSHRPKKHPRQHTNWEIRKLRKAFKAKFARYGWQGVYEELIDNYHYKRSFEGMVHAAKRLGLGISKPRKKPPIKARRYPELTVPGEKVQIDVKEVPYCCRRGDALRYGKRLYQWTAIDECTRERFIYGYEEHTPENSVNFIRRAVAYFKFKIQTVQTDNGTEFTYRFISETTECPFDAELRRLGIRHKLIPPRTPWHNGKVERSHRSDQRYFYDWETFRGVEELNLKLAKHLEWSNNRRMRTMGWISPTKRREQLMAA